MSAKKKGRGGMVAARQTKSVFRCFYCGGKTTIPEGLTNEPLARYPHSRTKQEVPPLCEASRQGREAQRRVS